ncbi:MAG: hypothetical protein KJ077_21880 [Anaerolineae bacterium]|nr:hypothetical protein [Anaerolineae bacterium]
MSRGRNTTQILKERLSVLAVILSCMGLVVVAQEAQQLFSAATPPTATLAAAPRTPQTGAEPTPAAPPRSTSAQTSLKSVKLSGKWVGAFAETVDGSPQQYLYTLELSQQGVSISGKSTIEKEDDPGTSARFLVRGQVVQEANTLSIKIVEELLGVKNLHSGSAAAPRNTRLSYVSAEGLEYLEGEWSDRRFTAESVTGTLKLTRQP